MSMEQQYYSDRLREKGITECAFHAGQPDWPECPDCKVLFEMDQENRMDAEREER